MTLTIDLEALTSNWRALAAASPTARAGAVVKADAYGLGADRVVPALRDAGAREFFTYTAAEGQALRPLLGSDARIFVLEGHAPGAELDGLIPCLVSPEQFFHDRSLRPRGSFAVQLDSGMNRLGFAASEWAGLRGEVLAARPALLMSHLFAADQPDAPHSAAQLARFRAMTDGTGVPRSLAATGGILLGPEYHFDLTRPGVGLYGGLPYAAARPVVTLTLPLRQLRWIEPGETVGYNGAWTARRRTRIATLSGGYADGLPRALAGKGVTLFAGDREVPLVGRVSMDAITLDVTDLPEIPEAFELIGPHRGIDAYAALFGSIGYEALTALGRRYPRRYL
ncbi:alanine racemase [Paracoccus sp. S-4012]|uniref:alanine racemase n=1 Tax=Paracoccus sp. S-4012 TaxID=2665648 RepID=UPI0012B0167F|nr:alanine racemase [Paracoccus sp. S-4012]MRX50074.1 alanine racemase [Paracoccus sp. S-4012]